MDKFISNLDAKANYKNIKKGFKWENIPRFAVITGENGSGKTALLEQINSIASFAKSENKSIFSNQINSQIKYFDSIKLEMDGDYFPNDESVKNFKKTYEVYLENRQNDKRDFYRQYISYFKRHGLTEQKFLQMSKEKFYEWLDSISDINIESKPTIFDEELLLNTFGNYFIKFENHKRDLEKQYQDKLVKEIRDIVENKVGKNPLDKVNEILDEHYDKYKLEITMENFYEIKLICREKESNALVPMSNLSLGEQIIISLIMWQYEDTTLDSVVLLLDEPDAHLNPKMAKMLIYILKNVVVKDFDCQVIMTTHSLSSVAYCDDKDLFFMENGKIRQIDKREAIEKLSDGVMTFDTAMSVVAQIQKSNKPTLMVEGKLDKFHIENFYKLSKKDIPFEIIECGGADNMNHFAIAFTQLKIPKEKILFLCDYDDKGCKAYDSVKVKYNAIYTLDIENIDKQDDRIRLKNYPLEMLYPLNVLQENNLLERISLKEYLRDIPSEQQEQKGKEFSENKCKTANKLKEDNKENFAKQIIQNLDINKDFKEIKNLIDRIEHRFKP